MSLLTLCTSRYGLEGRTLRPLLGGLSDHTYLLEHPTADPLVLRVERSETNDIPLHEQVLLFLEEHNYPAPRIIRTLDGHSVVEQEGMKLLLTSFISGSIVEVIDYTPDDLHRMGQAIGRLHTLGPIPRGLPKAQMLPLTEVAWASSELHGVADRVPPERRSDFNELLDLLSQTPTLAELPTHLIHNDCHPGNAVRQDDGEVILIDWDGAGLGPPIIDLGFLLLTAGSGTIDGLPTPPDTELITAVVDGYCHYRLPAEEELIHLEAAMRFRTILFGAASFTRHIDRGEPDIQPEWWRGMCREADEVARKARVRFDEH